MSLYLHPQGRRPSDINYKNIFFCADKTKIKKQRLTPAIGKRLFGQTLF